MSFCLSLACEEVRNLLLDFLALMMSPKKGFQFGHGGGDLSTAFFLHCVQFVASTSRQLCVCLWPSTAHTWVKKRQFSVGSVKYADNKIQDESSSYDAWHELGAREGQEEKDREDDYEHSVRQRILDAALNHVQEFGWTKQALEAGAKSEGLSSVAQGMFDRGGAEIIHHLYKKCNTELAEHMKKEVERIEAEGQEKPKTSPFIRDAIVTRLNMIAPYHSIWKEAMAIQTLPQNAPESLQNLMNLTDDIWYYAGDRSTDFDWYTKRLSLAAVYKATEIYMLQDRSHDFQDTWIFLDNRLNDIKTLGSAKRSLEPLKEGIVGLFHMGRNMVGMNTRSR